MGKKHYMSPEQILGFNVDARSDVFAVGVVLYELLALEPLFTRRHHAAGDRRGRGAADAQHPRPRFPASTRSSSRSFSVALNKDPSLRPTAAAMGHDLDEWCAAQAQISRPRTACTITSPSSSRRRSSRSSTRGGEDVVLEPEEIARAQAVGMAGSLRQARARPGGHGRCPAAAPRWKHAGFGGARIRPRPTPATLFLPCPKIYTRTGDAGQTGSSAAGASGKMISRVEAYGDVDELNAAIGLARATDPMPRIDEVLVAVQRDLFAIGALLATPKPEKMQEHLEKARIDDARIAQLEHAIDAGEAELPPLTAFILPGGTPKSAALHVARTVCRRAERRSSALAHAWSCHRSSAIYLNRLSDLLFVLARVANAARGRRRSHVVAARPDRRRTGLAHDPRPRHRQSCATGALDRLGTAARAAAPGAPLRRSSPMTPSGRSTRRASSASFGARRRSRAARCRTARPQRHARPGPG